MVCQYLEVKAISKSWSLTIESSVPQPDVYYIFSEVPLSFTGQALWNSSLVSLIEHLNFSMYEILSTSVLCSDLHTAKNLGTLEIIPLSEQNIF